VIGRERDRPRSEICRQWAIRRLEVEGWVPKSVEMWLMETTARVTEIMGDMTTILQLSRRKGRTAKMKVAVYGFLEEKSVSRKQR
jgi:hypothetical protein